nr:hypothetical protein [Deltaproteobacteria bacterium]
MQDLVKRYFWVLGGLVVMTCAVFAAKATASIVEAKFLNDPEKGPKVAVMAPSPSAAPAKTVRSKDGTQLAARNIFCSECTPPVEVATKPDDGSVVNTSLPLVLLATNVGPKAETSYATMINTESQRQGAYKVGDRVPGASGNLTAVHYKYVDFENSGHIERLSIAGANVPIATPVA